MHRGATPARTRVSPARADEEDPSRYRRSRTPPPPPPQPPALQRKWIALVLMVVCLVVFVPSLWSKSQKTLQRNLLNGMLEQRVTDRRMVIYCMKNIPSLGLYTQGMMQDFFHVLGALKYGEARGAAGVRVDFYNPMYSNTTGDNYWGYFFESKLDIHPTAADTAPEVHFNGYTSRFGMLGSFAEVAYGAGRDSYHTFPYPHPTCTDCGIEALQALTQKYVKLKPEWQGWLDNYSKTHFEGKFVIGMHYRHGDKAGIYNKGTGGRGMGCLQDYADIADRVISNLPEGQDYVIFVASDWKYGVEYFKQRYGARVLSLEGPRMDGAEALHKSTSVSPWSKATSVIMDMLVLSKAKWMIRNRSSVSAVGMLFGDAPKPKYAYIIGNEEIEHMEGDTIVHIGKDYPPRGPRKVDYNPNPDQAVIKKAECAFE